MKIGVIVSNLIKLPPTVGEIPQGYSGAAESVALSIAEGLSKRGNEVVLFASGDSKTSLKLVSVTDEATSLNEKISDRRRVDYEYLLISQAIKQSKEFDLLFSHIPARTAILSKFSHCPVVSTLHSPLSENETIMGRHGDNQFYISISNAQRKNLPSLKYLATIYHGIKLDDFLFSDQADNNLVFVGRIVPSKGLHTAMAISNDINIPISVLGEPPVEEKGYFDEILKLKKTADRFYGFVEQKKVRELVGRSKILLMPIEADESFGLVAIEAMACGTPVIAFSRGSMPEIIDDGKTGFLIEPGDTEGMKSAVEKIMSMKQEDYGRMRELCRQEVEKKFSFERMVQDYESAFTNLIDR